MFLYPAGDDPRSESHLQAAWSPGPVEGLQCCRAKSQRGVGDPALHFLLLQGAGRGPAGWNVDSLKFGLYTSGLSSQSFIMFACFSLS